MIVFPQAGALTQHMSKGRAALEGRQTVVVVQEAGPRQGMGQVVLPTLKLRLQGMLRQAGSRLVTLLLPQQPPVRR